MAAYQKRQVLYSATQPLDGSASLNATSYSVSEGSRGLVPYFVSGPLSRSGTVGFVGTALHVIAWILAVVFDIILLTQIDSTQAPGAFTFWLWGYITLMVGFVALVGVTLVHAFSSEDSKIPEGGAPPFLMTLFIGGAQISLVLTILQMIATLGGQNSDFLYINASLTATEREDKLASMRNLLVWTMLSKTYIVQFLKNNQEWAGPANELKKQVQAGGQGDVEGPRRPDGTFARARA